LKSTTHISAQPKMTECGYFGAVKKDL